jgi:two-component system cell cycle sensor histidine kinase/response regulator CckA
MTVLAVDDEPLQLRLMQRILEKAGWKVLIAGTAADAIRIFASAQNEIDLLITDVVMPDVDGPALAATLRALRPRLRVLFVSGFLARYEWVATIAAGEGQRFLAKPFSPSVLLQEVSRTLATDKKDPE